MFKPTKDQWVTITVATVVMGTAAAVIVQDQQVKKCLKETIGATAALERRLIEMEDTILADSRELQKSRSELSEVNKRITSAMLSLSASAVKDEKEDEE